MLSFLSWYGHHSEFLVRHYVQVGVLMTGKNTNRLCSPKSQVSMVTETQSRACIHQWWGLSVHWSNIYVNRLAEMLLVTREVSSSVSTTLEQRFFQPRAQVKDITNPNLNVFCNMNVLSFGSQPVVWLLMCILRLGSRMRGFWEPLIVALLVRWLQFCTRLPSSA